MPAKFLPANPDIEFYKKAAKALVKAVEAGDGDALARVTDLFPVLRQSPKPGGASQQFSLANSQFIIAREHGFPSWPKFKDHVDAACLTFEQKVNEFIDAATLGNLDKAKMLLDANSAIATANVHTAAILGDVGRVEEALRKQPALRNAKAGRKEMTPLLCACHSRYLGRRDEQAAAIVAVIRLLLKNGADPNTYYFADEPWQDTKETAIYGAAGINNHPDAAKALLEAGADPNDNESLYHSCEHHDNAGLRVLLEHGTQANGTNALKRKLDFEDIEGVKLLLDHGADPNEPNKSKDRTGETALHHAIRRGRGPEFIKLLVERGAVVDALCANGRTPYALAVRLGRAPVARALLELGAKPVESDIDRFLSACARADATEVKAMLANDPALVSKLSPQDHRVLYVAAGEGNAAAVRIMLEAGFDITVQGDSNETPAHIAAFRGDIETIKALLEFNPPLEDARNMYEGTVMGWTIHGSANGPKPNGNYPAVVEALLKKGAILKEYQLSLGSPQVCEVLQRYWHKTKGA